MGKVKDEAPAKSAKIPAKGGSASKPSPFVEFLVNLVSVSVFKPTQGKNARLWTALGLGGLVGAGLYRAYDLYLKDQYAPLARFGVPVAVGAALAWVIWRVIQFPPFADFLIATEAEMRKVSWTTPEALKRATIVVLATIFLLAFYLFAIDQIWIRFLQLIRILRFSSDDFGSQAG